MKKLISVLRKIQLFPMTMILIWNYAVVFGVVFASKANNKYLAGVPGPVCLLVGLVWIAAGVFLARQYSKHKLQLSAFWGNFLWNAGLPFLVAFLFLQVQDTVFTYNGMMPGLEGLWDAIYAMFILILAALLGLAYTVAYAWRMRKTAVDGSDEFVDKNPEETAVENTMKLRFGDVLNLVMLAVLVLALASGLLNIAGNAYGDLADKRAQKAIEEYRVHLFGENYEEKEQELVSDNFTLAFVIEYAATQDEELVTEWKSENLKKMYELGVARYKELLQQYTFDRGVDGINNRVVVDTKHKIYSCCYPIAMIDEDANAYVDMYMVLVYTEDGELADIHFTPEREVENK